MKVVSAVGILGVVTRQKAVDGTFNNSNWVSRGWWQVEVQINALLVGLWFDLVTFDDLESLQFLRAY